MKIRTIERLSDKFVKVDHQEELIQILREGIFNMNQKALINKYILRVFDDAPCEHEYVILANSGLTNNFEYGDKDGQVKICGLDIEYGPNKTVNYTDDLLSVDFSKVNNSDNSARAINLVKKSGLYVNLNTNKCYFIISNKMITDGVTIYEDEVKDKILSQCTLYKGYSWSNSEERNLRCTLVNATKYNAKERYDKLNKQLGGSLEYWIQQSLTFKQIQKLSARNGLQNPGALYIGEFANDDWGALFIEQKIEGNSDTTDIYHEYLKARGINLDNNILDGQHIKNSAWLVDVLYKNHNIFTTQEVISGIMEQERSIGSGNKSAGVYEYEDIFNTIVNNLKANYKYTIIGNPDRIAVIHDKNSAKIPNMLGSNFRSMILDIATAAKSAYTSGQQLSKLMAINKDKTCKFLYQKMYNNLIDMSDSTIDDTELTTTGSLSQILFGLNKEMASTDIYALTALGRDLIKYAKGAITRNRVKIKGSFYRAQFENTFLIANDINARLLKVTKQGFIECFNNDVIAKNRKKIRQIEKQYAINLKSMSIEDAREIRTKELDKFMIGMALKYPCPGNSEFELFRFLTKQEIKERTTELFNDEILIDMIIRYFTCRSNGCIVIANENILKHKLAGMDTDFDGITVVLEEELVDIAKEAYIKGTITGYNSIPSYTVILNKIKKDDKNYNIINDCINFKYQQSVLDEVIEANKLNGLIDIETEVNKIKEEQQITINS